MEFQIVKNGYNPEQVDHAIGALSEKYRILHTQYAEQETQYKKETEELKQKIDELKKTEHWPSHINTEAIGRALISAEASAQQLIEKAKLEAEAIHAKAKTEIDELLAHRKKILIDTRQLFENELNSLPTE